ncbi:PhzF family phenazine biosynthesis protein [Microbulbifer flavimaris]|uniref:PhzF family phenazine biosynthesis protein n=1 Tax=Microbulbifer flavimaris TaxID=1781068 RepID=A0ABX4I2Q0_9GAMM|nr:MULTISPECIES: PhzF family phenazine biosynthesis protein [Microbulbifer]KUJ83647.1 isomerase [Microbulbifer sp. ZGT114]PCO05809.1 PhzF family phenazine biosynthesis protein [Microbulbifer flavimaris]
MQLPIFQADAFTSAVFGGNPAALVPLEQWPEDQLLQQIAAENNLSETAFAVKVDGGFELRWFTPVAEVPLCGHATLAAAHLLWTERGYPADAIHFFTQSGPLVARREGNLIALDFPAQALRAVDVESPFAEPFGAAPCEAFAENTDGGKLLLVFADTATVADLRPDFRGVAALPHQGVICTAHGEDCDFVSRFFAPNVGIDEDPVTGSAHTLLTPFWAGRLGKKVMRARQISARGGELECELREDRVILRGAAVTYLRGEIVIAR